MVKIGRNELCPCGSGNKYKLCHGSPTYQPNDMKADLSKVRERAEADRVQRERQQGLGEPIISVTYNGRRFVAVKDRLLHSKRWLTFHDFLCDYIKTAFGSEWGNAEIAKPLEQRHPVVVWYQKFSHYQRTFLQEPGKVHAAPMTGAAAAYLNLAYDLYALDHNVELQRKLLARLRNRVQFWGARYEVYVAATFIRAGFNIEFENEDDGSRTHCEFTATHHRTSKRFSVEAKRRAGRRMRIGHLVNNALSKHANHRRIVFIDMNTRDGATGDKPSANLEKAFAWLRSVEGQPLNGKPRPAAYVFLTNTPWDLYLDARAPRCTALVEGFQLSDFKGGVSAPSLRHVIDAREAHIEMHDLMQSMKDHSNIPSTFDGEMPEYAFKEVSVPRIVIGQRYMVKDHDGIERPGEVTAATVSPEERVAYCGVTFEDKRTVVCTMPLSEEELAAWRRHPDTFFGVVGQRSTRADSPLELYDFFYESFKRSSKEQLLETMENEPDYEQLVKLDHQQLASIYAERLTNAALGRQHNI